MTQHLEYRIDDSDGYSLIEIMVVVLIIAILLAIAIPTYLSAKDTADAKVPESNLHTALLAEQSQWTAWQTYLGAGNMQGVEGSLTWTSGPPSPGNVVSVTLGDSLHTSYDAVSLSAAGHDGNCYTALASNDPADAFTAYNVTPAGSSGCPSAPAVPSLPLTVHAGDASASANLGIPGNPPQYYRAW